MIVRLCISPGCENVVVRLYPTERRQCVECEDSSSEERRGQVLPRTQPSPVAVMLGYERDNCLFCKRMMVPGVFANGYTDGPTLCHSCKRTRNDSLEPAWLRERQTREDVQT
jgi:hypothetical protein